MLDNIIDKYLLIILKEGIISQNALEDYKYHATCFVENFIVMGSMLLIGILLGDLIDIGIFMLCFFAIRNRAGGFHLDKFWKCFIGTTILECMVFFFVTYYTANQILVLDFMAFPACAVILIIGAINHPNMNYSRKEYKSVKKSSRIVALVEFFIVIFLKLINASDITIGYMECALILSAFLLVLGIITNQHSTDFFD